ncbi:MAG TPA: hypothetical protein V6D28_27825 [Leptolyngbyaceae cyanobacterium]
MIGNQDKLQEPYVESLLLEVRPSNGTDLIPIYSPGWHPASEDNMGLEYASFIDYLEATISLPSIGLTSLPALPESATAEEVKKVMDRVALLSDYKTIQFYSGYEAQPEQFICEIPLFNQPPFYIISLMVFFAGTNNTISTGKSPKTDAYEVLYLKMKTPLQGNDYISIRGSAIKRKSPKLGAFTVLYSPSQIFTVQQETTILAANISRENATIINYSNPAPGANVADYILWIKYDNDTGPGVPILPFGSVHQIDANMPYRGAVKGYSAQPTQVSVREGVRSI